MTNNDFILARNSGTPPVKLLFDKSLSFAKIEFLFCFAFCLHKQGVKTECTCKNYIQFLKLGKILDLRNYDST